MSRDEQNEAEYLKVRAYFESMCQQARLEDPLLVPYYQAQLRKLAMINPFMENDK